MKCDKQLDGKANNNMKVLSPDSIYHICSRLWEATGEQTDSRYPIVKLFVKSVQDMKVNNLDVGADAARMNDNSDEHDDDNEMPKTLLAGKDSKQLSVMLTRRGSNNLETLEGSEDRWWNWKKCDKPLNDKMISNMKVLSPSVIDFFCFRLWKETNNHSAQFPTCEWFVSMLNDALNQSIKSENPITSQFDVTAETTVNERASSLCFSTGKNPIVKSCSWQRMCPFVLFLCQCLKKTERGSGWLTQNKKLESHKTQNKSSSSDR